MVFYDTPSLVIVPQTYVPVPLIFFVATLNYINILEDMESIKTMFAPLIRDREQSLKYIEYSNFNSIQKVEKSPTEQRYNFLQSKVAETVNSNY